MKANIKKLSAYTIAENCSDITDVQCGIDELKGYFSACEKEGKAPKATAYIRFSKLFLKKSKLEQHEPSTT